MTAAQEGDDDGIILVRVFGNSPGLTCSGGAPLVAEGFERSNAISGRERQPLGADRGAPAHGS